MLIVNQIENTHFSKTEREIVDYIIDQGMNIEKMSANEIARNTFTSAPLLVRIAKKLGYSGFNEFKSAYLKELAYMLEETDVDASIPFLLSDDLMTISKNIALLEKETIQDTEQLNHHDELQHAIALLEKTKKIDVYGVLDNILLAKHFQTLMMDIGKDVQVIDQVTGQKRSACLADETHCAIIPAKLKKCWKWQKFIIKDKYLLFLLPVWQKTLFLDWQTHIFTFLQEKCYILK